MPDHTAEPAQREVVTVRVEAKNITKLPKGSQWVVIDSSLDSLWHGAYVGVVMQNVQYAELGILHVLHDYPVLADAARAKHYMEHTTKRP